MAREGNSKREVVVITGASAGLGRAIVREFARHGARIGLVARGRAGLEGAKKEVEELGGEAIVLPTDVADPKAVEAAADAVERKFGPIDIWVNDAMASVFSPFKEIAPEDFKRVTEVSYLGFVYGTMAALHRMLPRDKGTIVQVGSALGHRSIPLQSAYCGAKHAINGFTDSIRSELIHDKSNVHITVCDMPGMNTPQFDWVRSTLPHRAQPVPPIYEPEVGARAVYWAAHHRRREMWVGGSTAVVVAGNKFFPGIGDFYLGKTGFKSQQTGEPREKRPDNLYHPVDDNRDHGARGRFAGKSKSTSREVWMSEHKNLISLLGLGVAGALGAAAGLLQSRQRERREQMDERYPYMAA